MTLQRIALTNLRRRKAKAGFVLAGLLIGVATAVGLLSLARALSGDINHKLEKYGANILILPRTENLSLAYEGLSLGGVSFDVGEIEQADLAKIRSIKNAANVAAVGPMVLGVVSVAGRRVLLAGVDFEEARILKPWWRIAGRAPASGEVILGAEAARVLGLERGGVLEVAGERLKISGRLQETGSQDDQLILAPLATAQSLLGKPGRLSMVEVAALCTACPIEAMVKQISAALPSAKVMAIQQVVKGRLETLAQLRRFSYGLSGVVVLVGSLVVLVTMMGSIRERTAEIGVFRAVGFRRSHIIRVVLGEALTLSVLAGVSGYFAGLGAARAALALLTETPAAAARLEPLVALAAVVLAVMVGLAASAYPALLAARLDPSQALRAL